jgi:hypothetical protein
MELISLSGLEMPKDYQYLWRYIKPHRISDTLQGNVYMPTLREFDDYFEAITPMHLFVLDWYRKFSCLQQSPPDQSLLKMNIPSREMIAAHFDNQILLRQIRLLTGIEELHKIEQVLEDIVLNFDRIRADHFIQQSKYRASCWFVGTEEESAVMWKSYSEKGGVAIRIRVDRFLSSVRTWVDCQNRYGVPSIDASIYMGMVKYHNYQLSEKWMEEVKTGIPLMFFKHASYSHENELRIVIDPKNEAAKNYFQNSQSLLGIMLPMDVILRPDTPIEEFLSFQKIVSVRPYMRVLPSSMTWLVN